MTVALVFLGSALGSVLRYATDRAVQRRHDTVFPWGTLSANVVACLAFGALSAAALDGPAMAFLGPGLCAGLSTYSTFSYEVLRLVEQRAYFYAAMNVAVTVLACVGAALLGYTTLSAVLA